jgi:hypothetical protein
MSDAASGAPLPRRWFTAGTNLDVWGDAGTYKAIPYELLPALPEWPRDGSFSWLLSAPLAPHGLDVGDDSRPEEPRASVPERLAKITEEVKRLGLTVPPALVTFILHPELHKRVPSCTACYLDVPAKLVELDGAQAAPGARLLRFMNDQQCCLLWYVLLEPGGGHSVACAWPEIDNEATGETLEDVSKPEDVVICASSFEEFVQRFYLENSLWFASTKGVPLSIEQQAYAEAAKKARQSL